MAIHSSNLAWKILWTEVPGRLQSMDYKRIWHDLATKQQRVTERLYGVLKIYVWIPPLTSSGFPCGSAGKESTCNVGDPDLIPRLGRSPGEGNGFPLQYSGLENSMDYIVHGVPKSWTWLSDFHFHISYLNYPVPHGMLTLKSFLRIWFWCNSKSTRANLLLCVHTVRKFSHMIVGSHPFF